MPIYLMVDANNTAKVVYQSCIRSADLAFEPGGFGGDNRDELKAAELRCSRSSTTCACHRKSSVIISSRCQSITRGHPVCTGPSAEISTSLPSCRFQANSEVH